MSDKIKCNGGCGYYHISSDGNIFRCTAHAISGKEPIANIGNFIPSDPRMEECRHVCCTQECDRSMGTMFAENGEYLGRPYELHDGYLKHCTNKQMPVYNLSLTSHCNFKCYYCCAASKTNSSPNENWISFFYRIRDAHREAWLLVISNGESTTSPVLMPMFEIFSQHPQWPIMVMANGSNPQFYDQLAAIKPVNPNRIAFMLTCHISENKFNMDDTVKVYWAIRNAGFLARVWLVGMPMQIYALSYLLKRFPSDVEWTVLKPVMPSPLRNFDLGRVQNRDLENVDKVRLSGQPIWNEWVKKYRGI